MFKKLLYLYNDGHNPFPNMEGRGLITQPDGTVEWDENDNDLNVRDPHGFIDGSYIHENGKFILDMDEGPLKGQRELDESNVKSNTTHDYGLDDSFDDIHDDSWLSDDEDELQELNKEMIEIKEILKSQSVNNYDDKLTQLTQEEKAEKKNIIINNLQKKKLYDNMMQKVVIGRDNFMEHISKNKISSKVQNLFSDFFDRIILINENSPRLDGLLLKEINKVSDGSKASLSDTVKALINYNDTFIKSGKLDKEDEEQLVLMNDKMLKMTFTEFKDVEKLNKLNNDIEKKIEKINIEKERIKQNKTDLYSINELLKEKQKEYNTRKQELQSKERNTEEQIQKIKNLKKSNPERAKADVNEQKDELLEKVEKLKQQKPVKPVKKSEEEKQEEITLADIKNRLEHIKTLSPEGKPLETYFTKNGDVILHYTTGDYSKVYDNEFNKEIPNIKVTLNNGKEESLRKAVTIDLYSDKNVYEIKNYPEYSINDIIPLQETKIEGTGYFKPLYFKDGKLYNIQLNYTDPKTGQKLSKYILPENEEGRNLNVIYRLKEGLFEFKPMDLEQVHTKLSSYKSIKGKNLYVYERSYLEPCLDHHGNKSFNIQPYLNPIKLRLKK